MRLLGGVLAVLVATPVAVGYGGAGLASAEAGDPGRVAQDLTNKLAASSNATALYQTYTPEQQVLVQEYLTPTSTAEVDTPEQPVGDGASVYEPGVEPSGCLVGAEALYYYNVFHMLVMYAYFEPYMCSDGRTIFNTTFTGSGTISAPFWSWDAGPMVQSPGGFPSWHAYGSIKFSITFAGITVTERTAHCSFDATATTGVYQRSCAG